MKAHNNTFQSQNSTIKLRKEKEFTLSVTMPDRRPWASVSSTASTRLVAIISALDSLNFFTVLSPLPKPKKPVKTQSLVVPIRTEVKERKEKTKH